MKKLLLLCLAGVIYSGCATIKSGAPILGHSDTAGFNPQGLTLEVVYEIPAQVSDGFTNYAITPSTAPQKAAEIRHKRSEELWTILNSYGFQPAQNGEADFRILVNEGGETTKEDSILLMMVSSFSMLTIPHTYTSTGMYSYELWAGDSKVHGIGTSTRKKKLFGLLGIPLLAVNATGSIDRKARLDAHESVISSWIEQGAFE